MIMFIDTFGDDVLYRDDEAAAPGVPPRAMPPLLQCVVPFVFILAELILPEADHWVPPARDYEFQLTYGIKIIITNI